MEDITDLATKGDISDMRDFLVREMRELVKGVTDRQDKTNGRVLSVERASADHGARMRNLEREVFNSLRPALDAQISKCHKATGEDAKPPTDEGRNRKITERDVVLVIAGAGACWMLLKAAAWIGPLLVSANQAGHP